MGFEKKNYFSNYADDDSAREIGKEKRVVLPDSDFETPAEQKKLECETKIKDDIADPAHGQQLYSFRQIACD